MSLQKPESILRSICCTEVLVLAGLVYAWQTTIVEASSLFGLNLLLAVTALLLTNIVLLLLRFLLLLALQVEKKLL